jgi:FkbM family methyltransferase
LELLLFDIGANRGDATVAGLNKGYKVIALEPAPRIFKQLASAFIYNPNVIPLKVAVSDADNQRVTFYEAEEDGLSTLNKDWLTGEAMPYAGKGFRTISANTITVDTLVNLYGKPDLMKIDVEGAEWSVFKGMTQNYGKLAFEWTDVTIGEHCDQLEYLESIGYTEVAPQFIVNHLDEPTEWFPLKGFHVDDWVTSHKDAWTDGGWKAANLRPTADVGMLWVR